MKLLVNFEVASGAIFSCREAEYRDFFSVRVYQPVFVHMVCFVDLLLINTISSRSGRRKYFDN